MRNQAFYKLLRDGVRVEYQADGEQKIEMARLVDFEHVENNRFVAVNQLEIRSRKGSKRIPDIIGFVNGFPLVVFELKIRCVNRQIYCRRLISLKPIKMKLPSCLFITKP